MQLVWVTETCSLRAKAQLPAFDPAVRRRGGGRGCHGASRVQHAQRGEHLGKQGAVGLGEGGLYLMWESAYVRQAGGLFLGVVWLGRGEDGAVSVVSRPRGFRGGDRCGGGRRRRTGCVWLAHTGSQSVSVRGRGRGRRFGWRGKYPRTVGKYPRTVAAGKRF